jgi:hypothetical protein
MVGWIRLDSGLFVESGWVTAYWTGEAGRRGANVGGMGREWGRRIGMPVTIRLEAYPAVLACSGLVLCHEGDAHLHGY